MLSLNLGKRKTVDNTGGKFGAKSDNSFQISPANSRIDVRG